MLFRSIEAKSEKEQEEEYERVRRKSELVI